MIRTAYILNSRDDLIWFVTLPFVAIVIGLASERWLSAIAMASFSLWVTAPHHFSTWLRAYGVPSDFRRWRQPLILGPLAIVALTLVGIRYAPMTLLLMLWAWDHQHSIMQQYGFSRIYDHKAGTGAPATAKFDLCLNWTLYVNLIVVSPLYSDVWIREIYRFGVPLSASNIFLAQTASTWLTLVFCAIYAAHVAVSIRAGRSINPMKYLFVGSSYFLWYFTAWWTQSILVAAIAHAIMHGVQYIVISHAYLNRKGGRKKSVVRWMGDPANVPVFLIACLAYAVLYQLITAQPLEVFGFGAVAFGSEYAAPISSLDKDPYSERQGYELLAALIIHALASMHYFLDSFIWKVSDEAVQEGL